MRWLVGALLLLFFTPHNSSARFDGVPFTSWWEVGAVTSILLFSTSRELRRSAFIKWDGLGAILRQGIIGGALLVVAVKCAVYLLSPTAGQFEVCLRSFNARSGVPCTESFEPVPALASVSQHFPQRSSETPFINFGPRGPGSKGVSDSTWRLPLINSLSFDRGFWPWESDDKAIEAFPFWAEYRGTMNLGPEDQIRVSYLGQGRANIGGSLIELAPSYERITSISVSDIKSSKLLIDFAYLKTKLNSAEGAPPYAVLRVERIRDGMTSLVTTEISPWIQIANLFTDAAAVILLLGLLWMARSALLRILTAIFLAGICWLIHVSTFQIVIGGFRIEAILLFLVLVMLVLRRSRWGLGVLVPASLIASYSFTFREFELVRGFPPRLDDILVLLRGNDHLVYQGLTREMLNSGFLRGGEDVYYFQPGIRYVFYLLRFTFGESGFLTGVVCVSLLILGILFCFDSLPKMTSKMAVLACDVAGVSLLVWWSSSHTIQSTIGGLSEFGTWILLLLIAGLLLRIHAEVALPVISFASAAVIWIRPNQGFGVIALLALAATLRRRSGVLLGDVLKGALIPFGVSLLLIPLHNLVFGKTFALLPTGHQNALQTSWLTVFKVFTDETAREFMLGQLRGLLYLPSVQSDIYSARLALAVLGFGAVVILSIMIGLKSIGNPRWPLILLVGSVAGQLLPFLRFSLFRYYPIHNVAIYLTVVLCCIIYVALTEEHRKDALPSTGNQFSSERV